MPITFMLDKLSLKNEMPIGTSKIVTATLEKSAPKLIFHPALYASKNPSSNPITANPKTKLVQLSFLMEFTRLISLG